MALNMKQFEEYLNEVYSETGTLQHVLSELRHLGSEETIERHYENGTIGTLIRREDPTMFRVMHADYTAG